MTPPRQSGVDILRCNLGLAAVVRTGAGDLAQTAARIDDTAGGAHAMYLHSIFFDGATSDRRHSPAEISPTLLPERIAGGEAWAKELGASMREAKFADRQTLLLTRVVADLLAAQPTLDRERVPIQVAVGPARTDLDALVRWGERLADDEPLPMVQPASAVGLLPNTPLAWLAIRLGWRAEGVVWAGFAGAGHDALTAAVESIGIGTATRAVVAAVNSPDSWFVPAALAHNIVTPRGPLIEAGVALLLGAEESAIRLIATAAADVGVTPREVIEAVAADCEADAAAFVDTARGVDYTLPVAAPGAPDALTATLPLALALALANCHPTLAAKTRQAFFSRDAAGGTRVVVVEVGQ